MTYALLEGQSAVSVLKYGLMKKVAILANTRIPGVNEAKARIEQTLRRHRLTIEKESGKNTDLLITLGGDGTLLKGVHTLKSDSTLIFGLKFGQVGFLTNPADRLEEKIEKILAGRYRVSRRMLLQARVEREGKLVGEDFCLNEVVLNRSGIRIVEFRVRQGEEDLLRVRADAIILATPTGSTAHALAAGGPVIYPEEQLILLVPVCAYATAARPAVLPATSKLELTVNANCSLAMDGQRECQVTPGDKLLVRQASRQVGLVFEEGGSFFHRLNEKFGWPL
ncbi:MAG: NAD(+)/NADH kinase [Candidatus Omnitrophica bacterium]|nr:NAD(+)/NADH kinase [Candidatus Omnitrophota bacterium]